jgi:hypothetical protein
MLKQVITKNADVVKFVEHFGTKASMKNILKGFSNPKGIQVILEDEKFAEEILAYGNIAGNLETVLVDVFKSYEETYMEWKTSGNTRSYPDRVQFILGLIDDRIKTEPGPDIVTSLGDFAKSATGKTIEKVMKDAGNDKDDDLMDIMLYAATRHLINKTMHVEEPKEESVNEVAEVKEKPKTSADEVIEVVEAEVVDPTTYTFLNSSKVTGYAHEETKLKDTRTNDHPAENKLILKKKPTPIKRLREYPVTVNTTQNQDANTVANATLLMLFNNPGKYSDMEARKIIQNSYSYITKNMGAIETKFNNYSPVPISNAPSIRTIIYSALPKKCKRIHGINVRNIVAAITDNFSDRCETASGQYASRAIVLYTTYTFIDVLNHINDREKFETGIQGCFRIAKALSEHPDTVSNMSQLKSLRNIINKVNGELKIDEPTGSVSLFSTLMEALDSGDTNMIINDICSWVSRNVA